MQYMILMLFTIFFSMGSYMLLAQLLAVPTFRARKAVVSLGKRKRKAARNSDAYILGLAVTLASVLPMGGYKKRRLAMKLHSDGINGHPRYIRQKPI